VVGRRGAGLQESVQRGPTVVKSPGQDLPLALADAVQASEARVWSVGLGACRQRH